MGLKVFEWGKDITIYGVKGSEAKEYASNPARGHKFIEVNSRS